MKIHLQTPGGLNVIRNYADGRISINDRLYETSLVVLPDRILDDGYPQDCSGLTEYHFATIAALAPEVVLIGTGNRQRFLPPTVLRSLIELAIGFEIMDTGAACRTYNILVGEGRRVAALLLIGIP